MVCINIYLLLEFALNSILIDERLGFVRRGSGKVPPRLAIIPPSTPVIKKALLDNGYEVSAYLSKLNDTVKSTKMYKID